MRRWSIGTRGLRTLGVAALLLAVTGAAPAGAPVAPWPQWGGPTRNFVAASAALSDSWEERGPQPLWERPLGNGHSAIVTDGSTLYTMHGDDGREIVSALDADTGESVWRHEYAVGYRSHMAEYDGPHSAPLIADGTLVTVGIDAQVHGVDRATGRVLWRRSLIEEVDLELPQSGYGASPLRWADTVLLPGLGGSGPGAIALRLDDGSTAWARHAFRSSHASPILVRHGGREHAVFHGMDWLYGLAPTTGDVLWKLRLRSRAADNVSFTPLWDEARGSLLLSHGYDSLGTRAVRLGATGDVVELVEAWNNGRVRVLHGNGVVLDDVLYAAAGEGFLAAVALDDGALRWKVRMPKATLLAADGKLVILDEDGMLYLARPDADGLGITGALDALDYNSWTVPTLVDDRLYVRDRERIKALVLP